MKDFEVVKLGKEEYERGVKSGELLHAYDKQDRKVIVIKRDGHYSPDTLARLVDVDHLFRG